MTIRKIVQRIVYIILLSASTLAISSFFIFQSCFLLTAKESGVLSIFLFLIFILLFFKRQKLEKITFHIIENRRNIREVMSIAVTSLCFISVILYVFIAIILKMPMLWADEWNNFHRILFSENLSNTILSRYNQHPSYLINVLYAVNIKLLESNILWFTVINVTSILTTGCIYYSVILKNNHLKFSQTQKMMASSITGLFSFWIMAANNVFWNMPYFQVLGAIVSIYGLSIQSREGPKKGFILFLLGATLISTSFGNGAIVWPLGFIASILLSQKFIFNLGYLVIGILGSVLTMGIYSYSKDIVQSADLLTIIQAIPTYIGGAPITPITSLIPEASQTIVAMRIGIIGLITYAYLILNLTSYKIKTKDSTTLFGLLLGLFAIGCSVLIIFGRLKDDLSQMISGRYTCWSALFWVGILFLLISWISKINKRQTRANAILLLSVLGFAYITIHNVVMIKIRLITYNSAIRSKVDIIVKPDKLGNERITWHPNLKFPHLRDKVLEVNAILKEKHQNIYTNPVTHKIGKEITNQDILSGHSYDATALTYNDTMGNTYIEAYIKEGLGKRAGKPHSIVVTQDRTIVGLGLPYSDFQRVRTEKQAGKESLNPSIVLLNHFPGPSDYYFAQFEPLNKSDAKRFELFSFTNKGKFIKINVQ